MKFLFLVFTLVASSQAFLIPNGPAVLPAIVEGSFGTFDLIPEEEHLAVPMPAPLFPDIPSLTRPLPLIPDGPMTYPMPIPEGPQTFPMPIPEGPQTFPMPIPEGPQIFPVPIPEGPQTFPMPIPEETPVAKALPLVQIILNIVSDKSSESLVDITKPIAELPHGIVNPIAEVPHGIVNPIAEVPHGIVNPIDEVPHGIVNPIVEVPHGITKPIAELPVDKTHLTRPTVVAPAPLF